MNIRIWVLILSTILVLSGCKAKIVEIKIKQSELIAASETGNPQSVKFSAVFKGIGELKEPEKLQLKQISDITEKYFEDAEFEIDKTDFGYDIEIEGELPLVALGDHENIKTPWYIIVEPAQNFEGWYLAQIRASDTFAKFINELKQVSFMLSPDFGNPIKFKLRSDNLEIMAPAVIVDGQEEFLYVGKLSGKNSLTFRGGVFDKIGAGFYFK